MAPTGVLIGVLLAATPLFALGAVHPMLPVLGVGVMLGALAVAGIDGRTSRARDVLEVERRVPPVLSLGTPNRVDLTVRNRSGRPLHVLVKDDPPPEFATPERKHGMRLHGWEHARVSDLTTPHRRGDYEFGDLHVRGLSRLRLVWWQKDVAAAEAVCVYPNLQQLSEFDALARRGRLQEIGVRAARACGEGTEFESLREYVPDDSFRHIDWKATARRGSPITRQYQVERNQTVLILIDAGRMMAARAGEMTRVDYSINAALMLAHVARRLGDTVGLLVFSDRIKSFVPPSRGGGQAERMLEELYALEAELVEPDYRAAVTFLRARARKRAMICAFTDLVDPEVSARALSYLSSLRPEHLPLVATIRDEEIEALADAVPRTREGAYEKALASRTLAQRELALARLCSRGVVICDARPGDLAGAVISSYLGIKRRGQL